MTRREKLFSFASGETRSKRVYTSAEGCGGARIVRSAVGGVKNVTLTCEPSFL
jgi:hypothetical protein